MTTFVQVNREQRRFIASVLRKVEAEGEAWFLVTEDDVRYDPDALVIFAVCDEDDVRVELLRATQRSRDQAVMGWPARIGVTRHGTGPTAATKSSKAARSGQTR